MRCCGWILLVLLATVGTAARAETVYQPGHRTWTNSYVPPHYETKRDTRYVPPRNEPLDTHAADPQAAPNAPKPPPTVSVYTPPPYLDPYYNALDAAARPMGPPKLRTTPPPH
ncbi:MAG: hypothetical protein WDO24_24895 [Pseudomonadota bacterium]